MTPKKSQVAFNPTKQYSWYATISLKNRPRFDGKPSTKTTSVTTHVHPLTGLIRAIMETMLHGSQFYMLFKEAFHIYGSFFETNKDEEAF